MIEYKFNLQYFGTIPISEPNVPEPQPEPEPGYWCQLTVSNMPSTISKIGIWGNMSTFNNIVNGLNTLTWLENPYTSSTELLTSILIYCDEGTNFSLTLNSTSSVTITKDDCTYSSNYYYAQISGSFVSGDTSYTLDFATIEETNGGSIKLGSNNIDKLYLGSSEVDKVYLGTNMLYEKQSTSGNYVLFETDDGSSFTLGTDASSTSRGYHFGINGSMEYSLDGTNWSSYSPTQTITGTKIYLRGSNNTYLSIYQSCFLFGTQITLADGSTKNVEDLTYEDELKVWDFENGCYSTAPICWLTKTCYKNYHYYQLTFDDGTILKTTGQNSNHKVYNVDEQYFKGVNVTEVGDRIFSENGIVTVVDKQYIEDEVRYMNLITSKSIDCFAEGILTSDRYGNLYSIDENMKWIKDDRPIRPLSEFTDAGIDEYWYIPFRLSEQTGTIDEIKQYIERCEGQMQPLQMEVE